MITFLNILTDSFQNIFYFFFRLRNEKKAGISVRNVKHDLHEKGVHPCIFKCSLYLCPWHHLILLKVGTLEVQKKLTKMCVNFETPIHVFILLISKIAELMSK